MDPTLTAAWANRLGTIGTEPPEVGVARVRYASRFGYLPGANDFERDGATTVARRNASGTAVWSVPANPISRAGAASETGAADGQPATTTRAFTPDSGQGSPDPVTYAKRNTEAGNAAAFQAALEAWLLGQLPTIPTSTAVRTWVDAWTPPTPPAGD